LVIQELPGELLIYNLSTDRAFCLNETSAFVWKQADGKKTVGEIKTLMENEFNAPVNEDLIWLALDQLGRNSLMDTPAEEKFAGLSRREVVRRIGVSSLVALPVIASLATTVQAAGCPGSGAVPSADCAIAQCAGRPCGTNMTCQGGSCV